MVRRATGVIVAMTVLAACDPSPQPIPSDTPQPSVAAIASPSPSETTAPTVVPTVAPTIQPEPIEPEPTERSCPSAEILTVRQFNEAPRRCFDDDADVRIEGWLDNLEGLHGAGPVIRPTWLVYPESGRTCRQQKPECFYAVTLWTSLPPDLSPCSDEEPHCSIIFPHLPPGSDLDLLPLQRWVILTGHTHDPVAERCYFDTEGFGGDYQFDDSDAVRQCRQQFIVTGIEAVE